MHFQKQRKYQYQTQNYFTRGTQTRNPRTNKYSREIHYIGQKELRHNIMPSPEIVDYERKLEISNDESNPQMINKSKSIIRSIKDNINEKYSPSQLVGDQTLSSALHNFSSRFGEEREPSPKTINIGDTKETIEYNIRTLKARKSPRYYEEYYPNQDMNYLESNESEPRNGSYDGRKYYEPNIGYLERGKNIMTNRYNENNSSMTLLDKNGVIIYGHIYNGPQGGRIALGSPYQNFDEINTSNDYERAGSEDRKNRTYIGTTSYDHRQNRFENVNMIQGQSLNMNNYNNNKYNNLMKYNNSRNIDSSNINMTGVPVNSINMPRDEIQEKYVNQTYDNMTYKDVKKIMRRFTKVYDPNKNSNGLLVEESQVTLPGANDDIFNNRYRVLTKMNRLSNILLSKQRRPSPQKHEEDFIYNYSDEMSAENSDEYNIRTNKSFNRHSFEKRARSPLKLENRKSPENKFKYVSLAMISSKGLRTEDRVILRKMRFEKGGVVDLAQEKKKRGKYKIRKVSRSPGYKKNFYRTNPRYREKAAKYIQTWWKEMKELYAKKIRKIIKIQSVYRGRFVRKYLYDLLYLNYLYLSFCQKIEKVLKQKIKPYIFNILKNYGKNIPQEEKDYILLRNIVASKAKKWKIINLRKSIDKWKKFCRNKEKLILAIYKLLKLRAENKNKNIILKDSLRKWHYIVNTQKMIQRFEEEKKILIEKQKMVNVPIINIHDNIEKINNVKDENTNKIKGLFKLLNGINKFTKKSALEPTLPKLINFLSNKNLNQLLKKIINRKSIDDKEKLKHYFYNYIKMTLKYMKNKINELPKKDLQEEIIDKIIIKSEIIEKKDIKEKVKRDEIKIVGEPEIKIEPKPISVKETIKIIKEVDTKSIEESEKKIDELEKKKDKEISLMKARVLLHCKRCIEDKQKKYILKKYFIKYFKKIMQLQREEDRKNIENLQKILEEERKKGQEKIKNIEDEREKDKIEIFKYQEIIEKYKVIISEKPKKDDLINQINEKEIFLKLNKELNDKLKACQILERYVLRNTNKYPLKAFKDKLSKLKKIQLLIKILKIKENIVKNILRKYFNIWRIKTLLKYRKDAIRKLFIKLLSIKKDNFQKRILHKKLYQWRNNSIIKEEPKKIIEPMPQNIYDTLKTIKDIISFNDYLRDVTINKYGKEFLKKLDKTRNPILKNKYLKKIIRKKIVDNKRELRRAFNKWKNNIDVENAIKILRTKLIFSIYDKNKNINQNNILQKWFNRWKNKNIVEKIRSNINYLKIIQKETKIIMLKTILRNKNRNRIKDILKTYLNKWRNVIRRDIPLINEFVKKIIKINNLKNGPQLLDNLNKKRVDNKKNDILLKLVPKRVKHEKFILYKYLLRWRNKIYGINSTNLNISYGAKLINILLSKNDKQNLLKAFNKWRYGKNDRIPVNAYLVAIKKIKNVICKNPFKKFVNKLDKTNPKRLKPKAIKVEKIFEKITKEKPFEIFIKKIKMIIRVNQLKKIQPKVHDLIKKYYLQKYLNRWRNNTKEQRLKNMKIISKWLKKKYDIEKDKRKKRRDELLKRLVINLIKEDKQKLKFPLHFWKRITNIYIQNDNARIIQNFCRRILINKNRKKKYDQKRLTNLLIKLYKKTIIKKVTDKKDVEPINKFIIIKKENTNKLRNIIRNRDKSNNKILLRLAILKWNEGKPKYDRSIQIIQNKIRQIISKNKLNDKRLLQTILKHIINTKGNKEKILLRNKLLQWYAIAKKLNYHDTSKIEEFIRKIVVERLRRKLQSILNRYSTEYFIFLLKNIGKFNIMKNTLRKVTTKDALKKIKNYIRNIDIKNILNNLVKEKDDKLRILIIKKYFNKWNDKITDINNKENKSIILIQKYLRGRKIKNRVDRERKIKIILKQIILRYDENSPLNLYFSKWKRITKRISCDENAKIIQKFCRSIHYKYLKKIKDINEQNYKKLANTLMKIGKNPKNNFFDKLYTIYRLNKLEQIVIKLDNKKKDILKDILDKIRNYAKIIVLRDNLNIKDEQRKRILRKYIIKWRNKALSNKYIILYLTKILKNRENYNNNILRSILYKWLYKAKLKKIREKERIISEFCKNIARKIYIIKKWKEFGKRLRNKEKEFDIDEINNKLKYFISMKIIKKIFKKHAQKDINNKLHKNKNISTFKEKIQIIFERIDNNSNKISLKKYFDKWRNNAYKIKNRLDKLDELMNILGLKQKRDDATTLYNIILLKKLLHDIPKFFLINALYRIRDFANNKDKNTKLADDLLLSKKYIKNKKVSPLIKKLYKIYAYKVIDKLFNNIQEILKRKSEPSKKLFIEKMIKYYLNKDKEYTYSNKIENENKPYTKKILFKSKKKTQPKDFKDKSQIYLSLISILVKLIDDMIKKKKKDSFIKIKYLFTSEKFAEALRKYVYLKEKPNFEEFIDSLKIIIDMYEHDGPQKSKLFKLLRRIIIKKLFIYKEKIYRVNKLFYLVNLTKFNIEMAKSRWIRQLIRKWRFITFMKKMARKKMELMYKNFHVSYLEMVNSIFSDDEKFNPSVVKEFERFGYGVGMFINEDPFISHEGKACLGVKKQYLFQPIEIEKTIEIKKKVIEKEMKEEQFLTGIKGEYDNDLTESSKKKMGMSGRAEYDYDNTGGRYGTSFEKEDNKDISLNSKSKSKTKSKLKAHYSTKPFNENEDKEEENQMEKDKNM